MEKTKDTKAFQMAKLNYLGILPVEDENRVQYYGIVSFRRGNRILKKKGDNIAMIRKTTRNCEVSFKGNLRLASETINLVNQITNSISTQAVWYDFKKNEWHGVR